MSDRSPEYKRIANDVVAGQMANAKPNYTPPRRRRRALPWLLVLLAAVVAIIIATP